MKLSNKLYDVLRVLAGIVLPALAAFYVAISKIWGLPYAEEIAGSIAAVVALLEALLKINSANYFDTREIVDKVVPDTEDL
jgi:hypothetical protein